MTDMDQCARCGHARWTHDDLPDGHLFLTALDDAIRRHPAGRGRDPLLTASRAHIELGPKYGSSAWVEWIVCGVAAGFACGVLVLAVLVIAGWGA